METFRTGASFPLPRDLLSSPLVTSLRVLIAEDEAVIRLFLRRSLEEAGHVVIGEAGNGEEAVQLADALGPDVVILDIKMPRLSGLEAAERIGKRRSAACVIITAYPEREFVEKATQPGVFAFLVKPFHAPALLAAVELARARFVEVRQVERELTDSRGRLEGRRLIDRAKGVLMDKHGLKEAEAFRAMQLRSMQTRKALEDVAADIIAGKPA